MTQPRAPEPALSGSWCTGIDLTTVDGNLVAARTIEWGEFDLGSKLVISPRGTTWSSRLPDGGTGLTWTSAYGFVGISVSQDQFIGEGMNEAGLNAGLFYFKGYGSLAPFDPGTPGSRVTDLDLVRWMLSQFTTVDEVRGALGSITVSPLFLTDDGHQSPTPHWRVTDRNGGSIVIEIMNHGDVHVHDNHVGVITNSPDFPWHVANLNNYINVRPGTVAPRQLGGLSLTSFGTGTAGWGLPGDFSPPSRFVRASYYRNTAPPLRTTIDAVAQAFHILDNFDIPIGVEFADDQRDKIPDLPSATQWTAVSDLSSGYFYFTTMYDRTVKRVDLGALNLASGPETVRRLDGGSFTFQDVTTSA